MTETTLAIIIGFIIDLFLGDPKKIPHPVVFIGHVINFFEKKALSIFNNTDRGKFYGGIFICFFVLLISFAVPFVLIAVCGNINTNLRFIVKCIMCWQIIAVKSLKDASLDVYKELVSGNIESAKTAVSMLVGRDTQKLDYSGICRATVESVAESTSDGIVAPLFFMIIGGPCFGFLYKAVNTMDSMIGYKNDKYMFLGRAAAKTDDVFNFIPSRIAAVFMLIAAFLLGYDYKNALYVFKRDRFKHKSPNSAQTESVCAGALDVMLGGDAYYFGKIVKKDTIGINIKPIDSKDIIKANRLMLVTSFICVLFAVVIRMAVTLI